MVIFTVIADTISPEASQELCRIFFHTFGRAQMTGWIRGHCVIHTNNPCRVLIIQEWGSMSAWQMWAASESRANVLQSVTTLLATDLQTDVYEGT